MKRTSGIIVNEKEKLAYNESKQQMTIRKIKDGDSKES